MNTIPLKRLASADVGLPEGFGEDLPVTYAACLSAADKGLDFRRMAREFLTPDTFSVHARACKNARAMCDCDIAAAKATYDCDIAAAKATYDCDIATARDVHRKAVGVARSAHCRAISAATEAHRWAETDAWTEYDAGAIDWAGRIEKNRIANATRDRGVAGAKAEYDCSIAAAGAVLSAPKTTYADAAAAAKTKYQVVVLAIDAAVRCAAAIAFVDIYLSEIVNIET
jgi:hypothetical protein